jgi:Domain of unknown function (DUF4189)
MIRTSFRTHAAIWATGAAAVAALPLTVATTAHADNQWGGISLSPEGKSAVTSKQPTEDAALKAVKPNCPQKCSVVWTFPSPECGALGKISRGDITIGQGPTKE